MAMLQGAELLARERWGRAPDLVLSGPNEGQNVGSIILSSGTVSAAQYAALAGIPAIALSAGEGTMGADLALPESAEVARLSVELVSALEARAGDGPLLPQGLALNVNFPEDLTHTEWRAAQIGTYNAYRLNFVRDMAASATPQQRASAQARGIELPHAPGLSFERNDDEPTAGQLNDESIVFRTAIAVSPMQAGYAPAGMGADFVGWLLQGLAPSH
jgi:5'-nucleotidase